MPLESTKNKENYAEAKKTLDSLYNQVPAEEKEIIDDVLASPDNNYLRNQLVKASFPSFSLRVWTRLSSRRLIPSIWG